MHKILVLAISLSITFTAIAAEDRPDSAIDLWSGNAPYESEKDDHSQIVSFDTLNLKLYAYQLAG